MKKILVLSAILFVADHQVALAQSCFDLWYERNAIFNDNGYCFSTSLGRRTFDNSDCYTKNPRLSRYERRRVAQIKRLERRRGCRVNR